MRYRQLTASGDMTFGASANNYLVNSPACVAQAVLTRLRLLLGEWFLDTTDGTDYQGKVLGFGTAFTRDAEIQGRILGTPGVTSIASYSSALVGRALSVNATINTQYGTTNIEVTI